MLFFNVPYFKKPIFYIIKKNVCIANIFAFQKKVFVWCYSALFFPFLIYTITCTRYLYNVQIFLIQIEYRLQSMHIHMVERAGSIPSPLYSMLHNCSELIGTVILILTYFYKCWIFFRQVIPGKQYKYRC